MSDDLKNAPIDGVIEVGSKGSPDVTKIGTEEFLKQITELLNEKKTAWRSAKGLAEKLGVDQIAMDKWLRKQSAICSRPGKEEGVVYYALVDRLSKSPPEEDEAKKKVKKMMSRPIVTEEDRYATALLHQCYVNLHEILDKYALRISERSMEGFTHLVQAKDRLEAGITLYTHTTKADVKKLPRL